MECLSDGRLESDWLRTLPHPFLSALWLEDRGNPGSCRPTSVTNIIYFKEAVYACVATSKASGRPERLIASAKCGAPPSSTEIRMCPSCPCLHVSQPDTERHGASHVFEPLYAIPDRILAPSPPRRRPCVPHSDTPSP